MAHEVASREPRRTTVSDKRRPLSVEWLALPAGLLLLLGLWSLTARQLATPWLLPTPRAVLDSLLRNADRITYHAQATVVEVVAGFVIGFTLAVVLGYLIYSWPVVERLLTPYIVASQAIPIVAVAPLLVHLFGPGLAVKIATAAIIVFFPMLINTVIGLRTIDPAYRELMRALSATRWQTLIKLELPAALPVLLGGVRVGITLSVIGAVVGEFLGSDRGLGTLVNIAGGTFNDALVFATLFVLVALALTLYGLAVLVERLLLRGR